MQRNRRTRILVEDQTDLALQLAQEADGLFPVVVREPAHPGLMMTRVRESAQNTLFYLGEILVTRARVSINEQSGLGLLQGEEREKALALAVIDAAYPLLPDEKKASWDALLQTAEEQIQLQQTIRHKQAAGTKVSFDTMEVEQ